MMVRRPLTTLLVTALAVTRFSRLIVDDVATRRWRNRLAVRLFPERYVSGFLPDHDLLAEVADTGGIDDRRVWIAVGLSCRSCVGLWAALVLTRPAARKFVGPLAVAEVARRL